LQKNVIQQKTLLSFSLRQVLRMDEEKLKKYFEMLRTATTAKLMKKCVKKMHK